jgi:hypothetical protein
MSSDTSLARPRRCGPLRRGSLRAIGILLDPGRISVLHNTAASRCVLAGERRHANQVVKTNINTHKSTTTQTALKAEGIKLGIDVHGDNYRVVRQIDHATPQPAQKFTPRNFLVWARKQLDQAERVHSCYEAGPWKRLKLQGFGRAGAFGGDSRLAVGCASALEAATVRLEKAATAQPTRSLD